MNKPIKPLSPEEAFDNASKDILPEVMQAVNELLIEERIYNKSTIVIYRKDIIAKTLWLCEQNKKPMTSDEILKNKNMNLIPHFESAGWHVKFHKHKPLDEQDFEPYFLFYV